MSEATAITSNFNPRTPYGVRLVAFDIIFDAIAPSSGELIKLIINLKPYKNKGIFVGVVQIMGIVSNSENFAPY